MKNLHSCAVSTFLLFLLAGLFACQSSTHSKSTKNKEPDPNQANPMRWVTYSRQLMDDRRSAVDRMLGDDAEAFWSACAAKARQIDDWPMIRLLSQRAAASGDRRALPWLVRSWAMRSILVDDSERPEREAIAAITGRPASELLRSVVFEPKVIDEPATQVAAWSVMVRIEQPEVLRRLVAQSPVEGQSMLVSMLKRVEPAVDVLPNDRVAIAQMLLLTVEYDPQQWADWARWREARQGDEIVNLALRHLPSLLHRDIQRDSWSRSRWVEYLHGRLSKRRHASRGDGAEEEAVVSRRPEQFSAHVDSLGIGDLLVLDHVLDAMADPEFVRDVFEQAEADRKDLRTEYGGAIVWDERGELEYKAFTPLLRRHDQAYIASTPCMEAGYLGLAHVHFHTQRHDNSAWAGPGKGDLDFADSQHINGLVLTFLDRNTLNVDAYFPGEIIVDLGCVTR